MQLLKKNVFFLCILTSEKLINMIQKYEIAKLYDTINNDDFLDLTLQAYILCLIEKEGDSVLIEDLKEANELISKNICLSVNGLLKIENSAAIAVGFYKYFKTELNFTENNIFESYHNLYLHVAKFLKAEGYASKKEDISRELLTLLIIRFSKNGFLFVHYIDQLEEFDKINPKSRKRIYEFVNAYGNALTEIKAKTEVLYSDLTRLFELTESEATYNSNQYYLLEGLREFTIKKTEQAIVLFEYSCNCNIESGKIITALTAYLYEIHGEIFLSTIAQPYLANDLVAECIFYGLSMVKGIEHVGALSYLKLYESNKDNEVLIVALSKMLLNLISNEIKYNKKEEIDKACFERLENILVNYGALPAIKIIDQMAFIKGHENYKTHLLLTLIDQSYFNMKEFLRVIENVYWRLDDLKSFKQVLTAIADKEPFRDLGKNFKNFINKCDKKELDWTIIELVTDNKSSRRELGNSIFNANRLQSDYMLDYDLLSLAPLTQYKLWVGLCQNIGEPRNYLIALLPLLNSNSETVRESFISKLEELTQDYAGHITKALDDYSHIYKRPEVLERVTKYRDEFFRINADCKEGIAELNPYETQYRLLREFNKLHNRNFSRTIEKGAKENSFLSMIGKTVKLGKGGGWKFPGREGVKKLGHIQTGMVLPRSLFIYPEEYNIQCGIEQRTDWEEEQFDLIIQLIANE